MQLLVVSNIEKLRESYCTITCNYQLLVSAYPLKLGYAEVMSFTIPLVP